MMAIILVGGKQLLVKPNDVIYVEKIPNVVGEKVIFDKVLLVDHQIGQPYLETARVIGVVEKQGRQPKIDVLRYRPKSNLRRRYGHRQPYTQVKIHEIQI